MDGVSGGYFDVDGAGGTLSLVSPGHTGSGSAIKLYRSTNPAAGVDTGLDLFNSPIAVQANHLYRVEVWAESTDSTANALQLGLFNYSPGSGSLYGASPTIVDNDTQVIGLTSSWAPYVVEMTPQNNGYLVVAFRENAAGSVTIDSLSVQDVSTATANLCPDTNFDAFALGLVDNAADASYYYGDWRFYSVGGALGSLNTVTPGVGGTGRCLEIARSSMASGSDMGLDFYHNPYSIASQANHTYRISAWARSDNATELLIGTPNYSVVASTGDYTATILDNENASWITTSNWAEYVMSRTPDSSGFLCVGLHPYSVGDLYIDDLSVEDTATMFSDLVPDPSFVSIPAGTTTTTDGIYNYGPWRYYSVSGAGGTIGTVSPGYNGSGVAVSLTRTAPLGTGDTAIDLNNNQPVLQANHQYHVQAWAYSNNASSFWLVCPALNSADAIVQDQRQSFTPTSTWAPYYYDFVAPDTTGIYADVAVDVESPGTVVVGNLTLQDVCTITGTVTDSLSANPITGAVVSITSGPLSFSATTDSTGAYSVDALRSTAYTQTVSASGHNTVTLSGNPLTSAISTNVQLVLASGSTWSVTDTFTRPNSTNLGTTEDTNAVPWLATLGTSQISGDALVLNVSSPNGSGVILDRTLPADIDMTIDMDWLNLTTSLYAHIGYRNTAAGQDTGYIVDFPWEGTTVELLFEGNLLASAALSPASTLVNIPVRIKVVGNQHQVWVNGALAINVTDNTCLSGGPVSLSCDEVQHS